MRGPLGPPQLAAGERSGNGQRNHNERQIIHTVYILPANAEKNAKPQPVQIKTGITDGISTEVTEGLNEGDQIIIGSNVAQSSQSSSNPFGGGMPRMGR